MGSTTLSFLRGLLIAQIHWHCLFPIQRKWTTGSPLKKHREPTIFPTQDIPDSSICSSVAGAILITHRCLPSPPPSQPHSLWGKHLGCYYALLLAQLRLCHSITLRCHLTTPWGLQEEPRPQGITGGTAMSLVCFTLILNVPGAEARAEHWLSRGGKG